MLIRVKVKLKMTTVKFLISKVATIEELKVKRKHPIKVRNIFFHMKAFLINSF